MAVVCNSSVFSAEVKFPEQELFHVSLSLWNGKRHFFWFKKREAGKVMAVYTVNPEQEVTFMEVPQHYL